MSLSARKSGAREEWLRANWGVSWKCISSLSRVHSQWPNQLLLVCTPQLFHCSYIPSWSSGFQSMKPCRTHPHHIHTTAFCFLSLRLRPSSWCTTPSCCPLIHKASYKVQVQSFFCDSRKTNLCVFIAFNLILPGYSEGPTQGNIPIPKETDRNV